MTSKPVKSIGSYLQPSKSSQHPVVVMKFEFCAHSARLLRKLDHVLLWILRTNTGLCRVKKISITSNVLTLHFAPSQARLTISSHLAVAILLKPLRTLLENCTSVITSSTISICPHSKHKKGLRSTNYPQALLKAHLGQCQFNIWISVLAFKQKLRI